MSLKVTGRYDRYTYLLRRNNRKVFRTIRYGDVISSGRANTAMFVRWVRTPDGTPHLALVPLTREERRRPRHLIALITNERAPTVILTEGQTYVWADSAVEAETVGQCVPYSVAGHETPFR